MPLRQKINLLLALAGALVFALVPLLAQDRPWAPAVEGMAGAFLLGLLTPGSPVDSALDRLVGPGPADAGDGSEAAEAVREALAEDRTAPPPRARPRRIEGSAAGDVLGAILCVAGGVAVLIARGY